MMLMKHKLQGPLACVACSEGPEGAELCFWGVGGKQVIYSWAVFCNIGKKQYICVSFLIERAPRA